MAFLPMLVIFCSESLLTLRLEFEEINLSGGLNPCKNKLIHCSHMQSLVIRESHPKSSPYAWKNVSNPPTSSGYNKGHSPGFSTSGLLYHMLGIQ